MGVSPRVVTADTWITWDGVTQRLAKGQVMDIPPGSALEAAIGLQNLVPLGAVSGQAPQEPAGRAGPAEPEAPPAATEPQAAPAPEPEPEPEAPKGKAAAKAKAADVTASADLSGSGAKDGAQ